ncbi:MAG: hypothetical protein MR645_04330 [Paraprevotella sp.]|nr:hypothetical protein [Paraprevotella sp.]MCI6201347.1 hypothetical protein [Paraprevotella sp.]
MFLARTAVELKETALLADNNKFSNYVTPVWLVGDKGRKNKGATMSHRHSSRITITV